MPRIDGLLARWPSRTPYERVMAKVDKSGDCWLFTGSLSDDGYGRVKVDGKVTRAHRVVYESEVGAIPEGMHVLHSCDVRNCVRPDHLWIGDNAANMKDRDDKGRARGRFSKECVA